MKTSETIMFNDTELDVIGEYTHPEEEIRYADGSGLPEIKSHFEISSIVNDEGVEVTDEYDEIEMK